MTIDEEREYQELVRSAMESAKLIQDFIWDDDSQKMHGFVPEVWASLFQKRVDCIANVDRNYKHWKAELRKRLLQQAALSLQAILALKNETTKGG